MKFITTFDNLIPLMKQSPCSINIIYLSLLHRYNAIFETQIIHTSECPNKNLDIHSNSGDVAFRYPGYMKLSGEEFENYKEQNHGKA